MEGKHVSEQRFRARRSIVALTAGAVLALALGIGGVWFARTGVVVAVLAGIGALLLAVRELRSSEQETSRAVVDAAHAAALTERRHHQESMGIIDRFSRRVGELREQIDGLTDEADDLRAELTRRDELVATMRSTQESLLGNAVELRNRIVWLEEQLAVREMELRGLLSSPERAGDAEILLLPRRPQLPARVSEPEFVVWDEAVGH